ncbi:D-alanyl-D-alanine dipeptidase [Salmonella enterica subsp. enterica serovar Enteritidis str. SE30663]|nr:D-alanyl-D-alanine dipeptidase [Salmonella enterica subsp. enterica serovar Enteritidis str. SE30663]
MSAENHIDLHQPKDFVDITTVAPDVQVDMRYFSSHNFIGRPIKGYNAPVCLLTRPAANAVKQVADRLRPFGLTLKIYDCYRPAKRSERLYRVGQRSFSKPNEKRILSAGREKSSV